MDIIQNHNAKRASFVGPQSRSSFHKLRQKYIDLGQPIQFETFKHGYDLKNRSISIKFMY